MSPLPEVVQAMESYAVHEVLAEISRLVEDHRET